MANLRLQLKKNGLAGILSRGADDLVNSLGGQPANVLAKIARRAVRALSAALGDQRYWPGTARIAEPDLSAGEI